MKKIKQRLPESRTAEIQTNMDIDWKKWKADCNKIWEGSRDTKSKKEKTDYSRPSWSTLATTNPVGNNPGIRGCVAFHKIPCAFKKQTNGQGCTHCALPLDDKNLHKTSPKDQINAVKTAIKEITKQLGKCSPVLEILPNGSFLNEEEVPQETQEGVFDLVSKNEDILKIAVETRIKYFSAGKIKRLLGLLRNDQILEIYVGLESVDPFVLNKIIKKGFTAKQYEQAIKNIADKLSVEEKKIIAFFCLSFF